MTKPKRYLTRAKHHIQAMLPKGAKVLEIKGPFDRTANCLKRAGRCVVAAAEPDRD